MNEHPAKAIFSCFAGMIVGFHTLLAAPDQLMTLAVACAKAVAVGGSAWFGQTAAQWLKKKVMEKWLKFKSGTK